MAMPPKVCPECGEEYLHTATVCVHCDVSLVNEGERPAEDPRDELPPVEKLVCVRASSVAWAMSLSERLLEAGIPHRIQAATSDEEGSVRRPGQNLPYGVFVLPDDAKAAAGIDASHTEQQIPDIPEDFDPTAGDPNACPACGELISDTATECPSCGLALLFAE